MTLEHYKDLVIDWNLSPAEAVTLYLEWGNNSWRADHLPVRSKADFSNYFLVDTWGDEPVVRLIRRNSEEARELAEFPLPKALKENFLNEYGNLRGVFEPTEPIKNWLRAQLEN
ncbi:hypothetical protein DPQ33_00160 [Oceanidesulfovibrio indonesiensis]|uniref:Uncharacterized protein n=1 Tax=Oceanidesulfovibrio indonesiensis TaxID=54767 RepID=A0A7M3MJC9_9BACT|nr:hypothetical protein [Oceanidesulfovibrio indonesiensis]TVM19688.1 hypothetical protein DPQ33_00160 [Oceanidesulfovibrio indonesiensis]